MIRQITSFAASIVVVGLAIYLDLTYAGLAILFGIVFAVLASAYDEDFSRTSAAGYFMVFAGLGLLAVAWLVCNRYGISFDAPDQDRSFPKLVRRLPYLAIVCISFGAASLAMWLFRGRGPRD